MLDKSTIRMLTCLRFQSLGARLGVCYSAYLGIRVEMDWTTFKPNVVLRNNVVEISEMDFCGGGRLTVL